MLKHIYDKEDMHSVLTAMPEQIRQAYAIPTTVRVSGNVDQIIVCGMGGSSISGLLLQNYLELRIPIVATQNYHIPASCTKNSLLFIASYSGNTEESVSCYREAIKQKLNIVVIASGGKLQENAVRDKAPFILIPKGLQPRNAISYLFFPMIRVLENSKIITSKSDEVDKTIESLKKNHVSYEKTADGIAKKLINTIPIIYASERNWSIAYRWKCELNENAKIMAFANKFPELNHNEFMGYKNYANQDVKAHLILLHDDDDHKRIQKRMTITKKFIKEMTTGKLEITEINISGQHRLTQLFTGIYVGDFVSYFLALNYATDPTPVDIIERFKKEMGPFV
ncbi:MAG: bifunctional phosphoglucose/phosphomannose isomerase [Candidatus Woesearchaeota archaeon]